MTRCDVLIVGAGPAGSACARDLVRAGLDVVVADRSAFPRDKPCAGWVTPEVIRTLDVDLDEYARAHTLQPIRGFEVGVLGGNRTRCDYGTPVSYAIRRCEFDEFLLRRTGARRLEHANVTHLERVDGWWRADHVVEAPMLVGAGGHFCPVARMLNPHPGPRAIVAAQVLELPLDSPRDCPVEGACPELYFCRDLRGYGWCVRKDAYLNVGLGHLDARQVPAAARALLMELRRLGRVPQEFPAQWHGHAYQVGRDPSRRLHGDGVLLVGDAAGLALPASGEGILPAVVSGRLAARAILDAAPSFEAHRLAAYEDALDRQGLHAVQPGRLRRCWRALAPGGGTAIEAWVGRRLLALPWFARRIVVEQWFLHREGSLVAASPAA